MPIPIVCVADENAKPLSGATIEFVDRSGARDRVPANPCASPDEGFSASAAVVTLPGYRAVRVAVSGGRVVVTLVRELPTIGTVSVGTGSRSTLHDSPLATSVLDSATIASAPAATSDRLLRELPGFDRARSNSAFSNYGLSRISFAGAGNDRGAVFVDGLPAQDGFGGQVDWQAFPASTIARAELLRGAGSSLYGSGAIGGVLDVTTFGPVAHAQQADGTVAVDGGTNDDAGMHLAVRGPLGPNLSGSLEGTSARLAYADLAPGYTTKIDQNAKSTSGTFAARLRYDDAKTSVQGLVDGDSDHQYEGRPNYTFDRSFRQGSLGIARTLGDAFARITYYARDTTVENLSDTFPAKPGVLRYDQHVPTHEQGFTTAFSLGDGPANLQLRIDEKRVAGTSLQAGSGGIFQALGTGVETTQGIAVQGELRRPRFDLSAGARADRLRYDDLVQSIAATPAPASTTVAGHAEGAISPRVAARYDVGSKLALRASAGGGFRGPYLNELVRGFNVGKIFEAPNPNLVPERSTTQSAGADYLLGAGRLAFDVIETRVHDAIAFETISPTLMMRENFSHTQTDSQTLSYTAPLSTCTRVRLSGTTQRATVTSGPAATLGKTLAYVPQSIADLGIDSLGRGGFGYGVDASYVGQTYADDVQAQPLGAALLFGATVHATTRSGTTFALIADNVTKQRYLSSIDRYGPPQNATLRVSVPIGKTGVPAAGCQ